MKPLATMLDAKPVVILDGAMGTELQRRGFDISMPLWSARSLITHPQAVQQIHEDYIRAGADVITTNTFRTNRRALQRAGVGARTEELTFLAAQLAQQARAVFPQRKILIAGSIAPLEDCYSPELVPSNAELRSEHTERARLLAIAGVDFLLLETMMCIREALIAAECARETGAEFVISFVCGNDGNLLSGESLSDAVSVIEPLGPSMISINCAPALHAHIALDKLRCSTHLPMGIYANTGSPKKEVGEGHQSDVDAVGYTACAARWKQMGARLIGGCCGTTPEFVRRLSDL